MEEEVVFDILVSIRDYGNFFRICLSFLRYVLWEEDGNGDREENYLEAVIYSFEKEFLEEISIRIVFFFFKKYSKSFYLKYIRKMSKKSLYRFLENF